MIAVLEGMSFLLVNIRFSVFLLGVWWLSSSVERCCVSDILLHEWILLCHSNNGVILIHNHLYV